MSNTFDVQTLIMAVLNDHPDLPPVYDAENVPASAERPYGTFGPPTSTGRGILGKRLPSREIVFIDWWGNNREEDPVTGRITVHGNKQIAGFAHTAKHTLDGLKEPAGQGQVTLLRWEQDVFVPDEDQGIRHVQQRFRVDYEG